jgi:hypothetical protein
MGPALIISWARYDGCETGPTSSLGSGGVVTGIIADHGGKPVERKYCVVSNDLIGRLCVEYGTSTETAGVAGSFIADVSSDLRQQAGVRSDPQECQR